ncbi:atherin-like [Vulpes lagopus]|uniref:atherin-like n=1 Tax=Vulpes lagopus TaxID=494514 RepID=UPI001BC9B64D|nr:atherin-like [Vulpes lagopus]
MIETHLQDLNTASRVLLCRRLALPAQCPRRALRSTPGPPAARTRAARQAIHHPPRSRRAPPPRPIGRQVGRTCRAAAAPAAPAAPAPRRPPPPAAPWQPARSPRPEPARSNMPSSEELCLMPCKHMLFSMLACWLSRPN